jgi:hypothetical protein
VALAAALACAPGAGPFELEAIRGRVVDRDTGAPIAGAEVIQWWRGGSGPSDVQAVAHARFARSDGQGRFAFPRETVRSPRVWALKTYGPSWTFAHTRYGLVHGGYREGPGTVRLEGLLRDARARLLDLEAACNARGDDAVSRHLARTSCPQRPRRPGRPVD